MGVSTIPAALDGLVSLMSSSPDLSGVHVYDGAAVIPAGIAEGISVGWTDEDSGARAVESTADLEGLDVGTLREQYTISCLIQVVNGGKDLPSVRERAFELLAAVGDVLAASPTLGGSVMSARVGSSTLSQQQTLKGVAARVYFAVMVDAFQS